MSVVHVDKGALAKPFDLDGKPVDQITAFLFHAGGDDDPAPLAENAGKSFQGSIVLGMGFTFDDTDKSGAASPIALMDELIRKNPRNAERIFPYIGGEEVNDSPTHAHHRYAIDFGQMSEDECRRNWPDLMAIVETKVKAERLKQKDEGAKRNWWQFIRPRPELYEAIRGLDRVLVIARVSETAALTFLPARQVLHEKLVVFASDSNDLFCLLQSRVHEAWARWLNSTLKDDMQYTPSVCFETFPFPADWQQTALEHVGREYFDFRAALMIERDEGLTSTYNRFHDPNETDPPIVRLRELHDAMDRAVLNAYGWADIRPACEFLLDFNDDDTAPDGTASRRRKPYRYRWPDEVRDEVLGRLLALNAERANQEQLAGAAAAGPARRSKKRRAAAEGGGLLKTV